MNAINVGRSPDNHIVMSDATVSRRHAVITQVSPNAFIIEDNDSTNFTFVNGVRVKRSLISIEDEVLLGTAPLNLSQYFRRQVVEPKIQKENLSEQFGRLEVIWDTYNKSKRQIQTKALVGRSALTLAGMALGTVFLPFAGGMMIGSTIGGISFGMLKNDDEKLQVLDLEFKINYRCPKCKQFLGNVPFVKLKEINRCMNGQCNTVWL